MYLSLHNKRIIAVIAALAIFISAFSVMGVTASAKSFSNSHKVTAIKNISMYKSGTTTSSVVKKITKGTALYLTKNSSGNWVECKDSTGTSGFVNTKYIDKANGGVVTVKCTTTDNVNLRSGAGASYSVIDVVPKNQTLSVYSNSNVSWIKAKYGSNIGYLSKEYVKVSFKIDSTSNQPTNTNIPKNSIQLKYTSTSMYVGSYYQIPITNTSSEKPKWSSSDKNIATINSYGIITGVKKGTVTIKAKISTKTVSCKLAVKTSTKSVNISNRNYSVSKYKSVYLTSSTSGVQWSSSNTSVATVTSYGLVTAKNPGKTVISAKISGGWATCIVTVTSPEAVRFVYSNPNSAPKNSTVTFVAITDKFRTNVKFEVTIGKTKYNIPATSKSLDGMTIIWKAKKKLTTPGKYKIVAYSQHKGKWYKSVGSYGKAFVTKVDDVTTTSCEERHASNNIINFISNYEGFLSSAVFDPLTNFPCLTVGYGRVIYSGQNFYNGMTKNEAMAYLVDSVETDGYVSKVNSFLTSNKIKFNQRQFDSLVSLVYNCGTGLLSVDNDIISTLFNTYPSSVKNPTKVKTNCSTVLRESASSSGKKIKTLKKNTKLSLVTAKLYGRDWYKVQTSGKKVGYVFYRNIDIVSYNNKGFRDLCNTFKKNYINNFLCYHHAGGTCYYGLLYRRIDEYEIFYHGDYVRDGEKNNMNLFFRCQTVNPNFGCG